MRIVGSIAGYISAMIFMCILGWVAIFNPKKSDKMLRKAQEWANGE